MGGEGWEGRGWGAVHQILGDPKKGPLKALPFHSQDLISDSPYCVPYNSYDVFSSENLVLNQLTTYLLIFFLVYQLSNQAP